MSVKTNHNTALQPTPSALSCYKIKMFVNIHMTKSLLRTTSIAEVSRTASSEEEQSKYDSFMKPESETDPTSLGPP